MNTYHYPAMEGSISRQSPPTVDRVTSEEKMSVLSVGHTFSECLRILKTQVSPFLSAKKGVWRSFSLYPFEFQQA